MNKFYYLDSISNNNTLFYEIETELSLEQLKHFLRKQAFSFAKDNDIEIEEYISGEYEDISTFEVILNEQSYYFSFFTFISDRISDEYDCNLSDELNPTKILLKAEMII
jgi:hypothetical protein